MFQDYTGSFILKIFLSEGRILSSAQNIGTACSQSLNNSYQCRYLVGTATKTVAVEPNSHNRASDFSVFCSQMNFFGMLLENIYNFIAQKNRRVAYL